MVKYKKTYLDYFGYGEQDFIPCEACGKIAVDVHHVMGRIGKDANDICNLMALCRKHHNEAHEEKIKKTDLLYIHNSFLAGQRRIFLK